MSEADFAKDFPGWKVTRGEQMLVAINEREGMVAQGKDLSELAACIREADALIAADTSDVK